ncbi:hypothetical protein Anapl_10189 [Anas platyrhynchos]|uniref:Uncharacterized protein n=1 Tax=Anas platyrhynchos TaxID=8839 RepID=R0LS28_ANAPL|nr:hypothetical protein Anapl_10189 [Anas platyrhynchos]
MPSQKETVQQAQTAAAAFPSPAGLLVHSHEDKGGTVLHLLAAAQNLKAKPGSKTHQPFSMQNGNGKAATRTAPDTDTAVAPSIKTFPASLILSELIMSLGFTARKQLLHNQEDFDQLCETIRSVRNATAGCFRRDLDSRQFVPMTSPEKNKHGKLTHFFKLVFTTLQYVHNPESSGALAESWWQSTQATLEGSTSQTVYTYSTDAQNTQISGLHEKYINIHVFKFGYETQHPYMTNSQSNPRNLNLDKNNCQTTYQPAGDKEKRHVPPHMHPCWLHMKDSPDCQTIPQTPWYKLVYIPHGFIAGIPCYHITNHGACRPPWRYSHTAALNRKRTQVTNSVYLYRHKCKIQRGCKFHGTCGANTAAALPSLGKSEEMITARNREIKAALLTDTAPLVQTLALSPLALEKKRL